MSRYYVTTAIPYVNAAPHLGHALEAVQADILARHRRARGDDVRFQSGTDDNALKNVLSAEAAGIPVADFVAKNADRFEHLGERLGLSLDDFIRTSTDPRHPAGVERLWSALTGAGDLYQRDYTGLYCVGSERFYQPEELADGRCPEHGTVPETVSERNWFFRLSRYQAPLADAIRSGRLRIEPEARRNEVLAFVEAGLRDISVSRSAIRARGWGIPVPGDASQVIYVWLDALVNYISALGYGTDSPDYREWWVGGGERVHVIGKGILRFHAVYWPAFLLAAGEPLPTAVFVHDYLTVAGDKISKSDGNAADPVDVADRFGTDSLRWWLARDVPRLGDTDFTTERLVARANEDLANGLGNLVNRTVTLLARRREGRVPAVAPDADVVTLLAGLDGRVADALARFDLRSAAAGIGEVVAGANRYIQHQRPWDLDGEEFDAVLASLVVLLRAVADHIAPFTPTLAAATHRQLGDGSRQLPPPAVIFPRLAG